jgi:hypothetical protein
VEAANDYLEWWKYLPRALKVHNVEKLSTVTKHTPEELHEKFDDTQDAKGIEQLRRVVRRHLEKKASFHQKYVPIKVGDLVKVRAKHSPTDNIQKMEFKKNVYAVEAIDHTGMGPMFTLTLAPGYEPVENYRQVIYDPPDFAHPHLFLRHELLKVSASETPYHVTKPFSAIEERLRESLKTKADELREILLTKGGANNELSASTTPLRAFFKSVKDLLKEKQIHNSKILRLADFVRLFRDKFLLYGSQSVRPIEM